jgi:hypothetical protein
VNKDAKISTLWTYSLEPCLIGREKNKPTTGSKITSFIEIYTRIMHQTAAEARAQMQNSKNIEMRFIIDSKIKQNREHNT